MTRNGDGAGDQAPPVRVAFRTFGCKLNLYEASGMGQAARSRGFVVSGAEADGDADGAGFALVRKTRITDHGLAGVAVGAAEGPA